MRIWVTRAAPGAERTARRLQATGHRPILSPVMTVKPLRAVVDLTDVAAIAFSSANGVEAFAARSPRRDLPVFTVGDATAQAAREVGFTDVASAGGDVVALGRLLANSSLRKGAVVLHPGGRDLAGDLQAEAGDGVVIRTATLYETVARAPSEALAALDHDGVDAVLVHSSKAARRVASICAPWREGRAWYFALSPAVAQPLIAAGFEKVRAAPFPDEAALLKLLAETPIEPASMADAQPRPGPRETETPEPYAPPGPPVRRPLNRRALYGAGVGALLVFAAVAAIAWGPGVFNQTEPQDDPYARPAGEDAAVLNARIEELERDLEQARALASLAGPAIAGAGDAALGERVARLEVAQRRSARAAAAAIAASTLADAASTSRPFDRELSLLQQLTPGSPHLATLAPLARTGAPTRGALAAEFPTVAAAAASAAHAESGDAGVLSRLGAAFSALLSIRRVGGGQGDSPDAALSRAETALSAGDLEGALRHLDSLPPAGLEATANWRLRAQRRLEIDRRVAELRASALRDLAAAAPAAPAAPAPAATPPTAPPPEGAR